MAETTATGPAVRRPAGRCSAFGNLVRTESLLLVREVVPLLWGIGFPMALLAVMGSFSQGPDKSLGDVSLIATYEPILIAFTVATFALPDGVLRQRVPA